LNSSRLLKTASPLLGGIFDIANAEREVEELKLTAGDPDFWLDSVRAQSKMKDLRIREKRIRDFSNLQNKVDDAELELELWKEGESDEESSDKAYTLAFEAIEDIEFRSTLSKTEDVLSCILEINAGAGGTEACDWTEILLRMYKMWGEKNGFKVVELNRVAGDTAGLKSVEVEFDGDYAYGMLKSENGVHRLVRVSPFNSQGKRMTSFASVFVHPVVDDTIEITVNPADLSWDVFRASGAGGQHVNKTDSAVRVRHLPSGLVVECQQERSQIQNRETALKMLKAKLYQLELQRQLEARDKVEADKMKNEWGSQIRSYVLDDRRVKDHRTGHMSNQTDAVLAGDLTPFLKAYLMNKTVGVTNNDEDDE
jgi:peptide chain release factor 2